ncbi:hypothetical protein WUBG_00398 [Wuchereria bancrofti]|uniref:Uncharacterized protein n=1 Tax=Wuchereria bancrofti TaxID=6293 RepID=J9F2E7_WUCBA|nr:hypothetical protein WUBG_00398 [Wuchereria bancrofti]
MSFIPSIEGHPSNMFTNTVQHHQVPSITQIKERNENDGSMKRYGKRIFNEILPGSFMRETTIRGFSTFSEVLLALIINSAERFFLVLRERTISIALSGDAR